MVILWKNVFWQKMKASNIKILFYKLALEKANLLKKISLGKKKSKLYMNNLLYSVKKGTCGVCEKMSWHIWVDTVISTPISTHVARICGRAIKSVTQRY